MISWASYQIYAQSDPVPVSIEQPQEQPDLIALAPESVDTANATGDPEPETDEILYPVRPTVGENVGNLTLPAINEVLPIIHGTDEDELSRGIGHFAGSVLPGENDNAVLSGHRDTVFRELGQLEITDQLIVETSAGKFTYEIREIKIVPSDDKSIITPTTSAVLTVTTCYPFDFIGSSPDRYILIADLVSSE
ncbi:MAG TPA: class D sortase [Planococcus sp. (in: firmicutes)]|nr:class D sortase [Planococcus sp. (in: firmicutes)]